MVKSHGILGTVHERPQSHHGDTENKCDKEKGETFPALFSTCLNTDIHSYLSCGVAQLFNHPSCHFCRQPEIIELIITITESITKDCVLHFDVDTENKIAWIIGEDISPEVLF